MTPGEQMYSSATAEWCKDTYHIYFVAEDLYRVERSKHSDILAERMKQQWGVFSGDECLVTIYRLFESAKASNDKAEKAWDFKNLSSVNAEEYCRKNVVRIGKSTICELKKVHFYRLWRCQNCLY